MESKIRRSRGVDRVMTVIFYLVAIFFFALLIGFAGKVIIGGLMGAKPEMFRFARKGSIGNQLFNTIYLVFISLLVSIPLGVCAGIYLAMYAKQGKMTKFLRMCIETLSSLPSIVVGLFGYLVFLGCPLRIDPDTSAYHDDHRGCHQGTPGGIFSGEFRSWSDKMAVHLPCTSPGMSPAHHDRRHPGGGTWIR